MVRISQALKEKTKKSTPKKPKTEVEAKPTKTDTKPKKVEVAKKAKVRGNSLCF